VPDKSAQAPVVFVSSPGSRQAIGNSARMRPNEMNRLGLKERGGKSERFFAFFVIFCGNLEELIKFT